MKTLLVLSVLLVFSASVLAQGNHKPSAEEMHRLHQDSKAYIAFLEDPKRDEYQKRECDASRQSRRLV